MLLIKKKKKKVTFSRKTWHQSLLLEAFCDLLLKVPRLLVRNMERAEDTSHMHPSESSVQGHDDLSTTSPTSHNLRLLCVLLNKQFYLIKRIFCPGFWVYNPLWETATEVRITNTRISADVSIVLLFSVHEIKARTSPLDAIQSNPCSLHPLPSQHAQIIRSQSPTQPQLFLFPPWEAPGWVLSSEDWCVHTDCRDDKTKRKLLHHVHELHFPIEVLHFKCKYTTATNPYKKYHAMNKAPIIWLKIFRVQRAPPAKIQQV